jgi:hypothetical protein
MSQPPIQKEEDKSKEEEVDLDKTERTPSVRHDEDFDREELRRLREQKNPILPPLRSAGMRNQDIIKRRTGGILTGININLEDRERENLNSLSKIRGDGHLREGNFKSLRHQPKQTRMFKERLVQGTFVQIYRDIDQKQEVEEEFNIDEEDILEYNLFNSIDQWARRVSGFLNICAGVIVGMFVVQVMIVAALGDTESYKISLYFSQLFTMFVNLCVIFSIAETLIGYDKYSRLRDHSHSETWKFQMYFIISLVTSIVFMA